ncbi:MAG: hypothetical protein KGI93_01245 [Acidobacteriota bacterium]|nr:hypothetical protein [Acidobacteriota bacterium]
MKRIVLALAAAAVGSALAAVGASQASAQSSPFDTSVAFLCYSKFQVDPGVWPLEKTNYTIHDTASTLLGMGYWSPFAEKSVATRTELPGGYYLTCNLPAGMSPVVGTLPKQSTSSPELVTQKGALVPKTHKYAGEPGLYPLAA